MRKVTCFGRTTCCGATWARIRSTGCWRSTGASGIATTASARSTKPESDAPSQLCVAMLLQFHDRVCHEEAINQRVRWCRARRSWPIGERVSDILVGDGGCVGSDPKGRDVVCVAGFRMSETTAREGGQGAAYAAASHLCERAGDSEYLVVNRQSRTHVRTIAPSHQVPVDGSEERPIRTHDQQGVG